MKYVYIFVNKKFEMCGNYAIKIVACELVALSGRIYSRIFCNIYAGRNYSHIASNVAN